MNMFVKSIAASVALSYGVVAHAVPGDETLPYEGDRDNPTENCFWKPVSSDRLWNYVYGDSNAVYQCGSYDLPNDAERIEMKGEFPHSRYFSVTLYGSEGGDALLDHDIVPDKGSVNPTTYGENRNAKNRSYTLNLLGGVAPDGVRPPNTLYHAGPANVFFGNFICTRIYVPDQGLEPFGGTQLPEMTLIMKDGRRLQGEQMCEAVDANNRGFGAPPQAIDFDIHQYLALREGRRIDPQNLNLPERPPTHPAKNPPEFKAFFTTDHQKCVFFTPEEDCGDPVNNPDGVGLGNPLGRYVESYLDQGFGRVLVLRGKLPTTPKTWKGDQVVPDMDYDLRYFSLCPQESLATWRVGDCLFDEELAVSVDQDGFYTAVFSRPSFRPRNATSECGFAWAPTPPAGDGAGDVNLWNMWIRFAIPSPNFSEAAQNVVKPGTEEDIMGDYYPRGEYMSVEEFEEKGCPSISADIVSDAEDIMNSAQTVFPQLFPSSQTTQTQKPWLYRYYQETQIYLGVNQENAGVYVMGGIFSDTPNFVGSIDEVRTLLANEQQQPILEIGPINPVYPD